MKKSASKRSRKPLPPKTPEASPGGAAPRSTPGKGAGILAGAVILGLLACAAFFPALSAGYIWDDDWAVQGNALLHSPGGLWMIWSQPSKSPHYFPLAFSSFWVEYRLWGTHPFGYHLVNLLLHAANSVLLFFLFRRMGFAAAWPAAALFAVHPIQAATVCWVIERKNLLCAFFYILTFAAWLRFERNDRRAWHFLSLGFFALAMLSKSIAVTFPVAALIFAWWEKGRIEKRQILRAIPFFMLGGGLALISVIAHQGQIADYGLTPLHKALLAPRALCFYAAKLCWPADYMGVYPKWDIDPAQLWQYAFPALVLLVLSAAWAWRRSLGRGPFAALVFYAVSLAPILGFVEYSVMDYSYVHDHHQYLAAAGVFLLVAGGLERLWARIAGRLTRRPALLRGAFWALLLSVLSVLSWKEARAYENMEVFFNRNLERNPQAWAAMNNIAWALMERDALPEAEQMLLRALELNPRSVHALWNLGSVRFRQRKLEEALACINQALALAPEDARILAHAGRILAELGRYAEAKPPLERVLEKEPNHREALNNLAVCLIQTGDEERAETIFRRILRLEPQRVAARANLGILLSKKGETREAIEHLSEALRHDPGNTAVRETLERLQAELDLEQ